MKSNPRSPQLEKARAQQRRPKAAKKKKKNRRVESLICSYCSWTSICMKGVNETIWLKEQHLVVAGFNCRLKFWLN